MDHQQPPASFRIKQPYQSLWRYARSLVTAAIFVCGMLLMASLINAFIFQSYYVQGTSMQPTLHDDDRLIVGKAGLVLANLQGEQFVPERGDIVVLNSNVPDPVQPGEYERLIKRVIGLPGERLLIADGEVTIFNQDRPKGFNADSALDLQLLPPTFSLRPLSIQLDKDEVFVIGDNRGPGGSLDSRSFGPVKLGRVQGDLWLRVFPLSDVKLF